MNVKNRVTNSMKPPKTLYLKLHVFIFFSDLIGKIVALDLSENKAAIFALFITNHDNTDISGTYWVSVNHMNQ